MIVSQAEAGRLMAQLRAAVCQACVVHVCVDGSSGGGQKQEAWVREQQRAQGVRPQIGRAHV